MVLFQESEVFSLTQTVFARSPVYERNSSFPECSLAVMLRITFPFYLSTSVLDEGGCGNCGSL